MSGKIIQYKTVTHWHESDLSNMVNDAIKNGWMPYGGPCYNPNGSSYLQALVKYE